KLADMYVAVELARSNAYYGAWDLSKDAPELPVAAAAARVAACEAYYQAAKENIQVHGGMGFTWEFDCHLHYRRAKLTGLMLGSARRWKDLLVARLEAGAAQCPAHLTSPDRLSPPLAPERLRSNFPVLRPLAIWPRTLPGHARSVLNTLGDHP